MLGSLYGADTEASIQRLLDRPGPMPDPSFSDRAVSFLAAGAKGVPSGGLEAAGSGSDVLSAFGTALASTGGSAGGMFSAPSADERKQEDEARKRMLDSRAFDFTAGNALRRKADEFAPDPVTASRADQVIHGITRFGTKAITAVGTMGPAAGATALALEEGNTVAQRLRVQGVDDATAAKAGAVQGLFSGIGAVLPVGGGTIAKTAALTLLGGPASYAAQEALSRNILQRAGYNDQASLHDPSDPLGLALSTLVPGAFGALHIHGVAKRAEGLGAMPLNQLKPDELRGLKYNDARLDAYAAEAAQAHGVPPEILLAIKNAGEKSGPTAVSPAGAQGVMQFMEGTANEMGLKDRTDPVASIDAGAAYLRKLHDSYGSWDAAVAHYNGGGAQAAIVRSGGKPTIPETAAYLERVKQYAHEHTAEAGAKSPETVDAARVAVLNDSLKSLPDHPDAYPNMLRAADSVAEGPVVDGLPHPERVALEAERDSIEKQRADLIPVAADLAEPGAIRQARQELALMEQQRPDTSQPAVQAEAKRIQADEGLSYKAALAKATKTLGEAVGDFQRRVERLQQAIERNAGAQRATQTLGQLDQRHAEVQQRLAELPLTMPRRVEEASNALPAPDSVTLKDQPSAAPAATARPATEDTPSATKEPSSGTEPAPRETPAAASETPSLDTQVAQRLSEQQPDVKVVLPGSDEPVTIAEALQRIQQERAEEAGFGDLVRVAAECALAG